MKIKILKILNEADNELSLNSLRIKVGAVNFNSVKRNCEFLEKCGLIHIDKKRVEGRKYNFISITDRGKELLEFWDAFGE